MGDNPIVAIISDPADKRWKERLIVHLRPYVRRGAIELWDIDRIEPGADWRHAVGEAIRRAGMAVVLVSADFLGSDWICEVIVPTLIEQLKAEKLRLIPILIKPCNWKADEWLSSSSIFPSDGRALTTRADSEEQIAAFVTELRQGSSLVKDPRCSEISREISTIYQAMLAANTSESLERCLYDVQALHAPRARTGWASSAGIESIEGFSVHV
jgi:hypothetical protein